MQKNYTAKNLSMKEPERKSLERKIQKTAANLKVVDQQLPRSFTKNDSRLVPNNISTKTFKKGLTLHNLLCDTNLSEHQRLLSKSNTSKLGKTQTDEHNNEKTKIKFYRNLSSTLMSSSAVEHFEQSFSYGERGGEPSANGKDKCSSSINHGVFGSAGSTPVKKIDSNEGKKTETPKQINSKIEFGNSEEIRTTEKARLNESSETLVDDLKQQRKELKEKLTSANEKVGTVTNQIDRTLNESFFEIEQNGRINGENEKCIRSTLTAKRRLKGKSTQTVDLWQISNGPQFYPDKPVPNMTSELEYKMRTDSRELMRKHIETLREHMKVRVFLLHAKRKGLPPNEKKNGHLKFKALMDEFDEAKRKIKADFKRGSVDKGVLAKHYVEIGQLQRETRLLQSKLEQILNEKSATDASRFSSEVIHRQFENLFDFVNMEKRNDFVQVQKTDETNLLLYRSEPMVVQMAPFQTAFSPQIPPLDFDQLSVHDISCGDEGGEGLLNKTFTLPKHADKMHEEGESVSNAQEETKEQYGLENLSPSHTEKVNQNNINDTDVVEVAECHAEEKESLKNVGDENVSFSELTSAKEGDTSDDITSIPFPSETDNETNKKGTIGWTGDKRREEEREVVSKDAGSTPTSSRRFKYKIRAEERGEKMELSAYGRKMEMELIHCVVQQQGVEETEKGKSEQNEIPHMDNRLVDEGDRSEHSTAAETTQSVELADSVFEDQTEHTSLINKMGTNGPANMEKCSPTAELVYGKRQREEEEEVEVISAKSLVRSSALTQRTLAEVESIPEELSPVGHTDSQPNSSISAVLEEKMVYAESIDEQKQQHQQTDDSVTEEVFSDDIVSSFKPSEKSLHSILSLRSNSMSTSARDSMGKQRRDSASEALLKLRTMNCVPELRSPRESKSPPKPLRSPRGIERFMAKFPHNSSREASFSEEVSVKGEMLEELPNASQIGMLFDVSGASVEGTLSKLDSTSDSKRRQSDIFVGTDKRTDSVESNKMDRGDSLSICNVPEVCSAGVKARAEKTSHVQLDTNRILLAQFVYDHLNIWPTQEMLMEMDNEIIKGLSI